MTDDEITALEKLAEAATPGPLEYDETDDDICTDAGVVVGYLYERRDSDLYIAARTAVPQLCAEVRRLRETYDVDMERCADGMLALTVDRDALRLLASFYRSAALSGEALTKTDEEYLAEMRALVAGRDGK